MWNEEKPCCGSIEFNALGPSFLGAGNKSNLSRHNGRRNGLSSPTLTGPRVYLSGRAPL